MLLWLPVPAPIGRGGVEGVWGSGFEDVGVLRPRAWSSSANDWWLELSRFQLHSLQAPALRRQSWDVMG